MHPFHFIMFLLVLGMTTSLLISLVYNNNTITFSRVGRRSLVPELIHHTVAQPILAKRFLKIGFYVDYLSATNIFSDMCRLFLLV